MDREYAAGRRKAPHLKFRYRVRAQLAVDAFHERGGSRGGEHAVLELGAADGLTLLAIRDLLGPAGRFDGVELSEELLASVPTLPTGVKIHRGDVMALPAEIPADTYDLVTALAVLEHLPDPTAALREALRALKPGGVLVATAPNPLWDHIAGKLGMVADEHHEQELDERVLRRIVAEAGFVDVAFRRFMWAPVGFLPYLKLPVDPARSLKIDRFVSKLRLLDFGFVNQCIVAIKPR
ncbi:MAG: class I SAM-dependent methyltransferase [Deltaproteobacteria bacterium]|nr:class I SAM-dependent methyltransferase [Nannocystaceae bacterium]